MSQQAFVDAMRAAGLEPHADLVLLPGELQRFRVKGDKSGSKNGAAIYFAGPVPAGWFGSWKTGLSSTWCGVVQRELTEAERKAFRLHMERANEERERAQLAVQTSARQKADRLYRMAGRVIEGYPYLVRKGVKTCPGLRQMNGVLVVPAYDAAGTLQTLQFIRADGTKTFLTGGRVRGCYFPIGRPGDRLLLAEGLATSLTLHAATGEAVACCFNAGNLRPVAEELRAKYPRLTLVIVADNDQGTPGNPGVTKATAAAHAVGALLAVPTFGSLPA